MKLFAAFVIALVFVCGVHGAVSDQEQFLVDYAAQDGAVTTESGLVYKVISDKGTQAENPKPSKSDKVKVHYAGKLIDDTEFDSSYSRGKPIEFGVTQVIKGWTEALQLMSAGDKWEVAIPSHIAYGERGAGGVIPPNATLVFTIELLQVVGKENKEEL